MMKIRFAVILLIVIFIKPYVIYANDRDSSLFVTHSMNCVWRVYSNGNLEKASCFQDTPFSYRGSSYTGENSPLISPDQRYIAVIRQDDLWLYETDTKNLIPITKVGKPYTKKYLSIEVSTIGWSWDSRKLLYSVNSGDPGSGDDGFDRQVRPAKYGFYIYDVKDMSRREITNLANNLLGKLHYWQMLLMRIGDNKALKEYESGAEPKPFPIDRELDHINISHDGKWLVACADKFKQIVKIDLSNYNIIPLTPAGKFGDYQRPKFSPSGDHILYLWYTGKHEDGVPIVDIVVDGKRIYTSQRSSTYSWINDNTIAFTSGKSKNKMEVIIIDSVTGEIKGRHKIMEGKHTN